MAENQLVYDIRIEGTENQASRLNQIEVELEQLNKERKQYLDLMKQGVNLDKETNKRLSEITATTTALRQEKQKLNREIGNTIKANTAAVGSYNALTAANAKLTAKAKSMGDITGKNKVQFEQITAKINSNTDKLKELDAAMGNHQRNVGNYSGAIKGAFSQMGFFSREIAIASSAMAVLKTSMASSAGGATKFKTAMQVVKVALVSTGIGVVVIALGALYKYFTSSSEAALKFKNAIAPVTALIGNLGEVLQGIGKALFDAFSNINNFWSTLTGGMKDVRDQMGNLIADTMQEAALLRAMNNQQHLNAQLEAEDIMKLAKLEAEIAEARDNARNKEDFTLAQRRKAMQDALRLNKEIHQINMDAAAREIAVLNLKKVQEERDSQVKTETLKELAEAQAAYYSADTQFYTDQKGMRREISKLDKEYIEQQKQITEAINERNEANKIAALEGLSFMEMAAQTSVDTILRTEASKTAITQQEANKRAFIAKMEQQQSMEYAQEAMGMAASLFKENTAAYKVTASAEALMSTYLSANKALAQLPIPFSFIMAALLTAKGLQNVAAINNIQFATGGVVPSGHELPGSSSNGDNTLALVKPGEVILNKQQQSKLGGASTFASIGVPGFANGGIIPSIKAPTPMSSGFDMSAFSKALQDQRVYVLESDITKKQKNVRVIESLSSF